jgi:hypothetical protein
VQRDLDIQEYTDPDNNPMIPRTLVLKPGPGDPPHLQRLLVLGPPVGRGPLHDLRAVSSEIRPDWDLSAPGLRERWEAGDFAPFHGWNKKQGERPKRV